MDCRAEGSGHFAGRSEALIGIASQRALEPGVDVWRQPVELAPGLLEARLVDGNHEGAERLAVERHLAGQRLVGHHREGPQIGVAIGVLGDSISSGLM